jgi:two-component system nitrate/nitrite response regulator NarL
MPQGSSGGSIPMRKITKLRHRVRQPLTTRERQIVLVLSEGATNREIGRRLRVTEGTVKVHLHHIYRKLGIPNRTALAVMATS